MKVAYCFSGNLRTFDLCFPAYKKHLFDRLPGDVFCHTWDRLGHDSVTWWPGDRIHAKTPIASGALDHFRDLYRPRALVVESPGLIPFREKGEAMWYGIFRAVRLATSTGSYDRIFRLRPDLLLTKDFPLEEARDAGHLYIGRNDHNRRNNEYCDIYAHGPQGLMERYAEFYARFPAYANWFRVSPPECGLKHWVNNRGIPARASGQDFSLWRTDGGILRVEQSGVIAL